MLSRRLRMAAPGPLTCTFCATAVATGDAATITFNGVSIGNGGGRRREVVVLVSRSVDASAISLVTGITVDGRSASTTNASGTPPSLPSGRGRLAIGVVNASGLGSSADITVTIADAFAGSVCRIFVFEVLNGVLHGTNTSHAPSLAANPSVSVSPNTTAQSAVIGIAWALTNSSPDWDSSMGYVVGTYQEDVPATRVWINSAAVEVSPDVPTHTVAWRVTGDTGTGSNTSRVSLFAAVFKRA